MLPKVPKGKLTNLGIHHVMKRCTTTRAAEAVFVTKCAEEPVIICISDTDNVDLIGPPDPVSNLRPVVRKIALHETFLQQKLRVLQDETQAWNQHFWSEHNKKFIKERQEYIDKHLVPSEDKSTLTADEMSEFYKAFLDRNWKTHVNYNIEWYKRNFAMLFLALRVYFQSLSRLS